MKLRNALAGAALMAGMMAVAPRELHADPLIFCSPVAAVRDSYGRTGTLWMCYVKEESPWTDWYWYEVVW